MPNCCYGNLTCVLPSKNVDKFRDYFLTGTINDQHRKVYFYRTFLTDDEVTSNDKRMSLLRVSFECAWSAEHCFLKPHEGKDKNSCILLEDAIKNCDVRRLTIWSSESGMGFEESITYEKGGSIDFKTRDLYPDPLDEYLREEDIYEGGKDKECQIS